MRLLFYFCVYIPILLHAQTSNDELVNVKELIPGIILDLKYSTTDNFTGQKLYTIDECLLTHEAVDQLILVEDSLNNIKNHDGVFYPDGLGLKIWDGYRPRAIQYLMFEIFPDPSYVADPASGSIHNRGGAVDLTIVDKATGEELEMPTEFDYFGEIAWHGYADLPQNVINNRELLRDLMTEIGGFETYSREWWHYSYPPSKNYPLQDFQMK